LTIVAVPPEINGSELSVPRGAGSLPKSRLEECRGSESRLANPWSWRRMRPGGGRQAASPEKREEAISGSIFASRVSLAQRRSNGGGSASKAVRL
jgi:hypothetical protein